MPTIDLDITEDGQILLIALQNLILNISKIIDKPTHLRDYTSQFNRKQKIFQNNKGILTENKKIINTDFSLSSKPFKISFS